MKGWIRRRVLRLALVTTALLAVAGGVAYATIPDDGKVFHACMLNKVGTIRLIDPTLPSSNLMSKCSSLETLVSWNQSGQQGIQGIQGIQGQAGSSGADGKPGLDGKNGLPGANGMDGKDGSSIASSSITPDVSNGFCPTGGSKFSSPLSGDTYACNGKDGAPGKDGAAGKDGVSVSGAALAAGDANCPSGGSKFTSANGDTYACNGSGTVIVDNRADLQSLRLAPGDVKTAISDCPANAYAIGGMWDAGGVLNVINNFPVFGGRSWYVTMSNPTSNPIDVVTGAVCLSVSG